METLTALFGSQVKVKLLRLFLFNEQTPFFVKEIVTRTKASTPAVKRELNSLVRADLLKKKFITKEIDLSYINKQFTKKIKGLAYIVNEKFPYKELLKNLVTVASIKADESLTKRFANVGKVKLIVASGVFIQNWDARVDLLIVGEELNQSKIESAIRHVESEIGKEISYSAFETGDFEYRLGIHDRLIRDILDYNHVTLLDRLGLEPQ